MKEFGRWPYFTICFLRVSERGIGFTSARGPPTFVDHIRNHSGRGVQPIRNHTLAPQSIATVTVLDTKLVVLDPR